jgi:hypothetical protein
MVMLLIVSALVIGVSAAIVTPQYVNAASNNDDSSCSHQNSDNSKKCSKNDTPMILPFP